MRRIKREDEKGAMGVGTLIIFIAMVLVAAVAASVLIDTANTLQSQAQRTGDEAIQEVSSAFRVQDVYGQGDGEGNIEQVYLKVTLAAGAQAQPLDNTTIQVMTDSTEENFDADELVDDAIRHDEEDADDVEFIEPGDLLAFEIDLDDGDNELEPLEAQDTMDVNIIPKHGTPTYEGIKAPSAITSTIVSL